MRSLLVLPVLAGLALLAAPARATVIIDWVTVGNPGNAPDTATNCYPAAADCGSVAASYLISEYEVTNAQYADFLNAKASADPLGLYNPMMDSAGQGGITRSGSSGSYTYAVKAGFANKPVTYVSFYDALRFTNWLNNGQGSADTETGAYTLLGGTLTPSNGTTVLRNVGANIFLPSESQWYKAAYYDGVSDTYFSYPTGSNTMTTCSGPTAAPNSANCGYAVYNVTDVGAYTSSASPYGTYDQGGNVYEWNEQIFSAGGGSRRVRGGSWNDSANAFAADVIVVPSILPESEVENVGFRVASLIPEPGTGLLVMAGLAGLAVRQRRRSSEL